MMLSGELALACPECDCIHATGDVSADCRCSRCGNEGIDEVTVKPGEVARQEAALARRPVGCTR